MWNPIRSWKRSNRAARRGQRSAIRRPRRRLRAEALESRRLMAADPIHVGIVFIETDFLESESGLDSDEIPDRFLVSFTGGAEQTELTEFRVSLDKDQNGLSVGDLIFDTAPGGFGKAGWHPFKVAHINSQSGKKIDVEAEVEDGSTELLVRLEDFRAGDLLEFTIDLDEVLRMHDDLDRFNDSLDVIVSGQEMQDTHFWADFVAPHYEPTTLHTLFVNDYGDPQAEYGLPLPPNFGPPPDSFPSRTAAAIGSTTQTPKPVSISGLVWEDNNLNLVRDPGEPAIAGIPVALWRRDEASGQFVDTGHRQTTSANGRYHFGTELGLMPGEYRVVQTQPDGYFSVGAVVGTVAGQSVGQAMGSDILTGIQLPLGDLHAVDYDFAEARPASVGGYVYRDDNDNGIREPGEPGIGGVTMRLVPVDTIVPFATRQTTTAADGSYQFNDLPPGVYDIIQVNQPEGLDDGRDTPGTVDGVTIGVADDPGDAIRDVRLGGGSVGRDYNFGELPRGIIAGGVYLAAPGEDCGGRDDPQSTPLEGVVIELLGPGGTLVAQTTTGTDGQYRFEDISRGTYSIRELTPDGLIEGKSQVGLIDGVSVGVAAGGSLISDIVLPAGGSGTRYDFCEAAPAQISGFVYHDQNNNGLRDPSEPPIPNARLELVDAQGQVVAATETDAQGHYLFTGLPAGHYAIRQTQPEGFLDGLDAAGTIDGRPVGTAINPGDLITDIDIRQGQVGVDYNFGELLPASLSGRVHVDENGNCLYDPGEPLLAGVTVRLLDAWGDQIAVTQTDAEGRYRFTDLVPGSYTVVQDQPEDYFPGTARPGSAGGTKLSANRIGHITLGSGQVAVDYDFCEKPPAEISGFVYVDANNNQRRDPGEPPISGTRIDLVDAGGNVLATTTTNASGYYRFSHLPQGQYTLRQTQPDGFLQGSQQAGTAGGDDTVDNVISRIPIAYGASLSQYNFGELLASTLSGHVFADLNTNRLRDPGEPPLAGVTIRLYDDAGQLVSTTVTDSAGQYRFSGLLPGTYAVRQQQPEGYFHGGQVAGSHGGDDAIDDLIAAIQLPGGVEATGYDFPELPPASISGFVFQDGPPLVLPEAPDPADLRQYRDGMLGADSVPIPDVVVQLRNVLGQPVSAERALPGYHDGAIQAVTDANGYYQIRGLRPGAYHLYQVQPDGFVDGLDTPGSAGGLAVNVADLASNPQLQTMVSVLAASPETDPRNDAILNIMLAPGAEAQGYNFSEILVEPPPIVPPPDPPPDPIPVGPTLDPPPGLAAPQLAPPPATFPSIAPVVGLGEHLRLPPAMIREVEDEVTWHLSVINGGYPRGGVAGEADQTKIALVSQYGDRFDTERNQGRWLLVDRHGKRVDLGHEITFGAPGAIPLVGDFNGDGKDQVAIYLGGQWFIDLNGNGVWDDGDLWVRLGTEQDRPVVGDWDGDGKADVAIFGRRWERDPEMILRDPGLPTPANRWRHQHLDEAVDRNVDLDQHRQLQRGARGPLRSDAVDHVFRYGERSDTPVSGDFNGDGIETIGIFRGGIWTLDTNGDGRLTDIDRQLRFGQPGDIPVVGDWNGDGVANLGVVRGDLWIIDRDGDGEMTDNDRRLEIPRPSATAQPVVGDWDGDGVDEFGWYDEAG